MMWTPYGWTVEGEGWFAVPATKAMVKLDYPLGRPNSQAWPLGREAARSRKGRPSAST